MNLPPAYVLFGIPVRLALGSIYMATVLLIAFLFIVLIPGEWDRKDCKNDLAKGWRWIWLGSASMPPPPTRQTGSSNPPPTAKPLNESRGSYVAPSNSLPPPPPPGWRPPVAAPAQAQPAAVAPAAQAPVAVPSQNGAAGAGHGPQNERTLIYSVDYLGDRIPLYGCQMHYDNMWLRRWDEISKRDS